jgi:glycosyltransferase involved in cell wall biosynthesis
VSSDKPVIGIIVGTDFIYWRTYGGTSGLILSLIDKLDIPTRIFGIGYEGTIPWHCYRLNSMTSFQAVDRLIYPSRVPMRLKCLLSFWRQRWRILQSGVDVLYIHAPEIALPFLFGIKRLPVIYHQHGSGNPVKMAKYSWARSIIFQKIYDFIIRTVHLRADWTIAIDRLCLDQARGNGIGHKTSLIMNAIDTRKFYPNEEVRKEIREKLGIKDETRVMMFAGRLEEGKRVDQVVASIEFLNGTRQNGQYRLFIAGDGTKREELKKIVINRGLGREVTFLGYVPNQELPKYYNMADVLILTSVMEGVPMVVLEALACGTPVVASRVGGISDIVRDQINGVTLDTIELPSLTAAIRQVCERRYPRQEIAATVTGLSSVNFVGNLLTIIERILKQKGKT